jgi:glycosyltransferase involved in cell wall biosynthesis
MKTTAPPAETKARPARPKIVGLIPARNEAARLEFCLRALAEFTDAIVYLDDCSSDDSVSVVERVAKDCKVEAILRNTTWRRDEPGDRNRLLQAGRKIGGTHFIVIDADEAFTANAREGGMLRKRLLALQPGDCLGLAWIQLWRSVKFFRQDCSVWTNNIKNIAFADDGRCSYESDFIHTPRVPSNLKGKQVQLSRDECALLHFQFTHWPNLRLKQAWYRCMEKVRDPQKPAKAINDLYAPSEDESALEVERTPESWLDYPFFNPAAPVPQDQWRKAEVEAWFRECGVERFRDLNIWDLDWTLPKNDESKSSVASGPRVSVLVSTYRSEEFLRGCLEDLLAQTISSQLEIIVVNSGSPENEEAIVREFQERHKNIVYIRTERETLYGAWNRAVEVAGAPYLTNANTDDRHAPNAFEKLANALDRHPMVDVVYANCAVTSQPNSQFGAAPLRGTFRWPPFDRRLLFSVCYLGPQPMWRKILHRRFGLFDPELKSAGDYEFWLRISGAARFLHLPETLGLYLERPTGIEHSDASASSREREDVRQKHWPSEWGKLPPAAGNFFQPAVADEGKMFAPFVSDRNPLVSVIIPTFSRPAMLREAIESVLQQTFKDFEIIVINDGGSDISELISGFSSPRIVHVHHETSRERSAARNSGLALARGKYISYLDDDDIFYPRHLEGLLEVIQATAKKVAYSDANCAQQILEDGQYKITARQRHPSGNYQRDRLLGCNFIPILCLIHEKACLEAAGPFDPALSTHEDWDLWIRLSRHFDFVHLKEVTCEFRQRSDGSSTTGSRQEDFLRTAKLIHSRYQMYVGGNPEIRRQQRDVIQHLRRKSATLAKDPAGWLTDRVARPIRRLNRSVRKRLRI